MSNEFYGVDRSSPKPGDTVDPRTLPVGAEFKHLGSEANVPLRVVVAGQTAEMVGDFDHGPGRYNISDTLAVVLSLPQPIADEVVELGTLRGGERFEFHESRSWHCGDGWDECQLTVIGPSQDGDGSVTCERADGAQTDFMPYRKVRRVPAPTPAKRPPCDACGEESCPSPSMGLDTHGGCRFCSKCWHLPHADNMERVRSRRAKQTSGSETPKCAPSNPQLVDRPLSEPEATNRWQTRDPARIAALEAKLAKQVASGGQGGKSARWLLERADRLRREAENQPTERLHPDKRRALVVGTCVYLPTGKVEPGPRLMRHELPSDQRLDRKLTGR